MSHIMTCNSCGLVPLVVKSVVRSVNPKGVEHLAILAI
jgi:primosomal replication protein N